MIEFYFFCSREGFEIAAIVLCTGGWLQCAAGFKRLLCMDITVLKALFKNDGNTYKPGPLRLSIKLYVALAMYLWFKTPLFSLSIPNHKHLASTT